MPEQTYDVIELSDLILKRGRAVNVRLGPDFGIAVRWNPDALTPDVWAAMSAEQERAEAVRKAKAAGESADENPFAGIDATLYPLLLGWSLTDKGQPYPLTPDTLKGLGLLICQAINAAIMADFKRVTSAEEFDDTKGGSGAS